MANVVVRRVSEIGTRCEVDVILLDGTCEDEVPSVVRAEVSFDGVAVLRTGIILGRRIDGNADVEEVLGENEGENRGANGEELFPAVKLFLLSSLFLSGISWRGAGLRRLFISTIISQ